MAFCLGRLDTGTSLCVCTGVEEKKGHRGGIGISLRFIVNHNLDNSPIAPQTRGPIEILSIAATGQTWAAVIGRTRTHTKRCTVCARGCPRWPYTAMIPREYGIVGRKNKIRTFGRRGRKGGYIIRATPAFFGICAIEREREREVNSRVVFIYTGRHIIVTAGGTKWPKWRIYFSLHSIALKEKRIPGKGERTTK